MTSLIEAHNVRFAYRGKEVLHNISLALQEGKVISMLGPNGSGKTTLLKILVGILQPKAGSVTFEKRTLRSYPRRELAKKIAYVPQTHKEAFAYTVEDIVLMGRMPYHSFFTSHAASATDLEIAENAMARLGILYLRKRAYTEVSGGERQLTLIARAIAQGAEVFVMDEPVNGLDYGNQMRLLSDIKKLSQEGLTFIMTTHFPDHALMTADRSILLKNGSILADGAPDDVITRDSISELYRIDVNIISPPSGGKMCMPAWAI